MFEYIKNQKNKQIKKPILLMFYVIKQHQPTLKTIKLEQHCESFFNGKLPVANASSVMCLAPDIIFY